MRQTKFRGIGLGGDWHYGNVAFCNTTIMGEIIKGVYISDRIETPFAFQIKPETLGQWTGEKDKNKIEIYEGDVVEEETENLARRDTVEFKGAAFYPICEHPNNVYTVIGNIHEPTLKEYNEIPRRMRMDLWCSAEKKIFEAMKEVESTGCDKILTDAVNLLHDARKLVADYIDNKLENFATNNKTK